MLTPRVLSACRGRYWADVVQLPLHTSKKSWSDQRLRSSQRIVQSMAGQTRGRSALEHPCAPQGVECIVARLRELPAGPHPPVAQKLAAVLVPLFQDAEGIVRVLLTQRSANLTTHKGEVCLPGGKRDPEDADDVQCALREAQEELGIDPASVQIVAQLPPFLSKHQLSVTPVIGKMLSQAPLKPNADEVNAVFDMPLAAFLDDVPSHTFKDTEWAGLSFRIHYFEYNNFLVWGLTAGILIQIAQKAFGRPPGFLELSPGSRPYHQLFFNGERLLWRDNSS